MRRNEIDWIRNISVLLLFLFHTASIFMHYEPWYIWSNDKCWLATIIFILCIPWHMPILFFLAGASTRFSLNGRSGKKYIFERVKRLLIPFIVGMLILVPPQGYIARVSRGKPVGTYFQQYKYFWTTISKIPYDGGLGPAHLWFILYLFVISIVGLFIIKSFEKKVMEKILLKLKEKLLGKYSLIVLMLIFFIADMIPVAIAQKNILLFLIVFLMGYIVYGDKDYLEYMVKSKEKSAILAIIFFVIYTGIILDYYSLSYNKNLVFSIIMSLLRNGIMITTIVAIIGYGTKYLDRGGKLLTYLNKACFPVYILHQTVIVIISYYLLNYTLPVYVSILIIIGSSVIITFGLYEIIKRIRIARFLIGIK